MAVLITAQIKLRRQVLVAGVLALIACALPQLVRDQPLVLPQAPGVVRVDGLGAFFVALALLGATINLVHGERPGRVTFVMLPLLVGLLAEPFALTASGLALAGLLAATARTHDESRLYWWARGVGPALLLLAAAGVLGQAGSWRLSDPLAGAGFNSLSFGLVLAAVLLGILANTETKRATACQLLLLVPAWCYPLVRMYSLGPWNNGWHIAALLLSGTLMLWAVLRGLEAGGREQRLSLLRAVISSALLTLAFGSSAGLAAGSYGLLGYLLLAGGLVAQPVTQRESQQLAMDLRVTWLLSPAVPLTAPFVAAWMALGAAVASSLPLAGLAVWLAALLSALGLLFAARQTGGTGWLAGGLSLAAGILAPVLIELLILPPVEQLQGGLSPFGELEIWPWIGLAMLDSQRRQVAVLPSLLVAGLLAVLIAMIHLLVRLLVLPEDSGRDDDTEEAAAEEQQPGLWELVRRQVFWLGGGRSRSDETP